MSDRPPPAAPPPPARPHARWGVALMLAVAAVVAAAVAARASLLASAATERWQAAVREELKLGAAIVEDVRYVYNVEAPQAFRIATARIRAEEYRRRARSAAPDVRDLLLLEARAQDQVVEAILPSSEIASDEEYATEAGGFDLGRRLADNRARYPDLVALDPDAEERRGDEASDTAVLMLAGTIPVGFAFLFGALAQAYPHRRRTLLAVGWVTLVAAVVFTVVVELTS